MKHISLFVAIWLFTAICHAGIKGDLNGDGRVSIKDVATMIRVLGSPLAKPISYDVNGDNTVNKLDLDMLVAILLGQIKAEEHESVDLGLSVKWATCNLGADEAWQYGDYYAWGELSPKSDYSENQYTYLVDGEYVNIGSNICGTRYDAATTAWGSEWRMPNLIDINQLLKKCQWTEETLHGINGYRVTGPNGNSIFLPKAGMQHDTAPTSQGVGLYYWCGMASSPTATSAYVLNDAGYTGAWSANRSCGFTIRPVCNP